MTDTVSEIEISFEVWQDADMVASADNLSDAEHFMLVYAQDGPVEAKTAITTRFLGFNVVTPMLAASPKGEGSSAVAWREALKAADDLVVTGTIYEDEALLADAETVKKFIAAHPAPIKTSADTGELRERVAASIGSAWAHGTHGKPFDVKAETDAILDLIQSERAGSPIGQNDQPGLAFSDAGEP